MREERHDDKKQNEGRRGMRVGGFTYRARRRVGEHDDGAAVVIVSQGP